MHPRLGGFARYRDGLAAGGADLVVGRYRELEDHVRALVADAPEMSGMIVCGLARAEPDIDCDAGGTQSGMALPGHLGVGILDCRHHAGNASGHDGISAGRRLADMRAWLQRHIERGTPRGLAGPPERLRLGVGTAAGLGPAAADDDAVLDDDSPDGGIGPGAPLPAPPQRQRQLHEAPVGGFRLPGFLRELVFQNAEDHLRNRASRASSSPESSPSTVSKSLASRKLR